MKERQEVDGLHEIYKQANAESRKKMITAAAQLLEAQKIIKNEVGINNRTPEQERTINGI